MPLLQRSLFRGAQILIGYVVLLGIFASTAWTQPVFWQRTAGPYGGEVNALAIAPDGAMYAGSRFGLFRMIEDEARWVSVDVGFDSLKVDALAVTTQGDLVMLTEGQALIRWSPEHGLGERIDDGIPEDATVSELTAGPNGEVYAAAFIRVLVEVNDGYDYHAYPGGGLYRLDAGAQTWREIGLLGEPIVTIQSGNNYDPLEPAPTATALSSTFTRAVFTLTGTTCTGR